MGNTYTRQSAAAIATGNVIQAADIEAEFDTLVLAFNESSGHTHDSTAAEGGPIATLYSNALSFGTGADTDIVVTFNANSNDGVLTWMEDEDHFKFSDDVVLDGTKRLYFNDEGGEYIHGDGTDLNLVSGADINIPANIGLTFGDDGEKIEGDGTDLTISGNNINLTAVADVNIPSGVGITFATTEKIESDGTDLSLTVGGGGDINIPADIGLTFGNDGEKIEGDGTDLTIAGNNINLTAVAVVVIPANVGITFGSGEKIEGDSTDLTVTSGGAINLTATSDIVLPANVGITFGSGEKIEGDNTDLTVTSGGDVIIDADDDIILDANGADVTLKDNGTVFGALSQSGGELLIKSGSSATTAMTMSGANVTFAGTVTIGSAGISEAELEILDGATVTTAELNIIDGDTSATGTTVADADRVVYNDGGTMKQVAVTDLAAYFDDEITAMPNLVTTAATTVGALNSGSITSGFGTIDTGSSTITTTGAITGGSLTADDVAINGKVVTMTGSASDTAVFTAGTNGTLSIVTTDDAAAAANITITADGTFEADGTTITLDSSGDIDLNASGGDVFFKSDSTTFGSATNTSGDLIIKSGTTTALTFSGANVTSAGVVTATGFTIGSAAITEAELEILDGAGVTTAELNMLDGSAKSTSSITVVDADAFIVIDGTTTKQIPASDIKTYAGGVSSADVTSTATSLAIALG